jgi:hypothetical protein
MRRAVWVLGLASVAAGLSGCAEAEPAVAPTPVSTLVVADTTTAALELPQLATFDVQEFDVQAMGGSPEQAEAIKGQVNGLLDRYLTNAMLVPLRTGQLVGDVSDVFAEAALARLTGPDRGALLDEGLPKASDVKVETAAASVSVLMDRNGDIALVWTGIRINIGAKVGDTPVAIERTGELMLALEGDDWKISAYDISVTRDTPQGTTTSVAP